MEREANGSITRAFAVLEYLAAAEDWVQLRSLARDLGMRPSTAHRVLGTLRGLGYVQQEPISSRYGLSLKVAWLSSQVLERTQLREVAHGPLVGLADTTNETAHLAVIENAEIVYVDKVDGRQPVRMRSGIGKRGFVHSTAVGKAIAAFLPEEKRAELLSSLDVRAMTPKTLTNRRNLDAHLEGVRRQGYSVDDEENEIGIRCLGCPVFDHTGTVVAAVSVSGWTVTMTLPRLPELAEQLKRTCRDISGALGQAEVVCEGSPAR